MDQRRVHTLSLRSASQPGARRAMILIEDALRTASLPGVTEDRLIFVQSLSLGAVDIRLSPANLELRIEESLRVLHLQAFHGAVRGAEKHPVVFFRDRVEAFSILIRRLARHEPCWEWFWPLLAPGLEKCTSGVDALRLALTNAWKPPAGTATLAALFADLLAHSPSSLEAVLDVLQPADDPILLEVCGWQPPTAISPTRFVPQAVSSVSPSGIPAGWEVILPRWVARWGPRSALSTWLAALAMVAERSARLSSPELLLQAHMLCKMISGEKPAVKSESPLATGFMFSRESPVENPAAPSGTARALDMPAWHNETHTLVGRGRSSYRGPDANPTALSEERQVIDAEIENFYPSDAFSLLGQVSAWSGLYFLLPALVRLGLAEWLAEHPELLELMLPQQILAGCARLVGIPADDAILAPLGAIEPDEFPLPFIAPQAWEVLLPKGKKNRLPAAAIHQYGDRRGLVTRSGLMLALWQEPPGAGIQSWLERCHMKDESIQHTEELLSLNLVVQAWISALRRWVLLFTGMSLLSLLHRPGRILVSHTHLTISQALEFVDLRIRKAGLDLDPGWLPWFGRVVQYKFLVD